MDRASGAYPQRESGGTPNHGKRGGQDVRAYSISSDNSGGSGSKGRGQPILRSTLSQSYATPPKQRTKIPALSLDHEYCNHNINGNNIKETFKPRSNAYTSPHSSSKSLSPSKGSSRSHHSTPGTQDTQSRSLVKRSNDNWASDQGARVKLINIPKVYWTKDLYLAMCRYGTVVKIEMIIGSRGNDAIVTLQPLSGSLPKQPIAMQSFHVPFERMSSIPATVASPVNPRKRYFEVNTFFADTLGFGTRTAQDASINMYTVQTKSRIQMTLDLKRKEIDIRFPLLIENSKSNLRFRMPFSLLSNIYRVVEEDTDEIALIIPFDNSPQFFVQKTPTDSDDESAFSSNDLRWVDWNTWFRETDIVSGPTRKQMALKPLSNYRESAIIDIGQWTLYRLCFGRKVLTGPKFSNFCEALADYGIMIQELNDWKWKPRVASQLSELLQEEISGTHPHLHAASASFAFDDLLIGQITLPFKVRYQLEVCLSNGYIKEHSVTRGFLQKLVSNPEAVRILEKVAETQHVYYDPMKIFGIQMKSNVKTKIPSYCILQRSATITPTMIHVASPVMEISNRITRKYIADADRFIRIKFSDEKTEGPLRSLPGDRAGALFDRVSRAMKHGIVVAGRYYEFLAFGNSQFREHGAYFYAPTMSKSADDIRISLGQFDHIKTVAKFGARLGQCFSTTRAMRVSVKIRQIPDIARNGYNFTDGVGKLSPFLAKMAAQELGLPNAFDLPPSLYQFRLGGCKGVLALDPQIVGSEVHIRPSQQKFHAEFTGLEIIRCSTFATPFLNRQIIMVLSALKVPDRVFVEKQQEMVNAYEQAMQDENMAIQKLQQHIDMNQTSITMASMVLDGFMKAQDPFMMSLLMLWRSFTIKNLKEKARIAVDDGAFVLGCVDETATLRGHFNSLQRSGATDEEKLASLPEIFLQVDDINKKGHCRVIEGICVLARNPSLHPGDARIVRAVNVPALHHHRNVVVLPQTGDRDLANMCSGGDLDGDDYMIIWDNTLIPKTINVAPMDFTPIKPLKKEDPITVSDMADFFVTFMKNDSLGRIAHAHLAQADQEVDGVQSDVCLELAKLHSQAVDYPKSGIPAVMNDEVRPKKWPHFMEKKFVQKRQIYTSKNILGQLYDRVQLVDFKPQWENPFDKRILNAFQLEETLLSQAADVKIVYDESLKRLMAKHGLRTEFEAWSVFVLAHSKDSNDYKFAEEFGRAVDALKSHFRDICRTTARAESPSDWSKMGPFVAAMYTTTAREMEEALKECRMSKPIGGQDIPLRKMDVENMPLISFPWLFVRELGKIATGCATLQLEPQKATHHTHRSRKQTKVASEVPIEASTVETEAGITHFGEPLALDFGPLHSISTPDVPSTTEFNKIRREAAADESLQQSSLAHKLPSTIISFAESNKPFIPASLTTTKPYTWTPKPRNPHSEEVREEDNISQLPIRSHTHVEETTQNEGTMQTEGTTRTEGIPENDLSFAIEIDHSKPSRLDRLMQIGRG